MAAERSVDQAMTDLSPVSLNVIISKSRAIAQKEQRQARQREIICEKEIKQTFSVPHKIAIASHEFQP